MIRTLLIIFSLLSFQKCFSQGLFTDVSSHIFIERESNIHIGGAAVFNGRLENIGLIELDGDVNFVNNQNIGNIKLTGNADQLIDGSDLVSKRFELEKEKLAILKADKLDITENFVLNQGVFSVSSSKLTVSGFISGGSDQSYVTGSLSIISTKKNNLHFPVGVKDKYEPLIIHSAPNGELSVEAWIPNPNSLIPGDSLIGLADEASWKLSVGKDVNLNSQISINYSDIDLQNYPVYNAIRANKYAPVIAYLTESGKYMTLEIGDGSDETISSFGKAISRRSIQLSDSTIYLSIGIMPVSDGLKFYVPSIFTPSGTMSENRRFRSFLLGTEIEKVEMNVWDKFNNKVFYEMVEDTPLDKTGWNGQFKNGMNAPQGIYYYTVIVTGSGGYFEKTGTVLLIR